MWKKICDTISDITDSDIFDKVQLVIISVACIIGIFLYVALYVLTIFAFLKVLQLI